MYLLVRLFYIRVTVGETASHGTAHNKVERFRPGPVLLKVVQLKRAVWRHAIKSG